MGRGLIVGLLMLNLLALLAGVAWEYWKAQPRSLPSLNADKIRMLGAGNRLVIPPPVRNGEVERPPDP